MLCSTLVLIKRNKKKEKKRLAQHIGRRVLSEMAKMPKIGKRRHCFLYNHLPDGLQKLDSPRTLPQRGSYRTDFLRIDI